MVRQHRNKGFSLIETMMVLLGMGLIGSIMIRPVELMLTQADDFQSLVIHHRFMALYQHRKVTVTTDVPTDYPIRFTAQGHINMGQTIRFKRLEVVLMIATGRLYEKSVSDD